MGDGSEDSDEDDPLLQLPTVHANPEEMAQERADHFFNLPRGGQEIQDEIDRSAPGQAAPDMVRAWIATQPNAGDRRDQEKDPRRARDQGHGRREASRAPMQSQGRDGREQGDASRQAKPAVPQFVPVNDEIMTEASQAPCRTTFHRRNTTGK